MRDLFVIVADLDAENVVKALLCQRQPALGVRLRFDPRPPPQGDLLRYAGRDSGCYQKAVELLRPVRRTHQHVLVLFDWHGSGAESRSPSQIEDEVESRLAQTGWPHECVAVVVVEPELEAWVWSGSPHVAQVLGWGNAQRGLRTFLQGAGLWPAGRPKPTDPKAALQRAAREKRCRLGARILGRLASRVSLKNCHDRAFQKFRNKLADWFSD